MSRVDHIAAHTWHGREGKARNAFRYSVDYVLLDAEDPAPAAPRVFGRNRAGLASLQDRDHGGPPGQGAGAPWVRRVLAEQRLLPPARIELLTQPRMLGHVFNPVSFWFCRDDAGGLRQVIAEVSNTFGDRHSYLCVKADGSAIGPRDRLRAKKVFHVSPFQPIEGDYVFRFDIRAERVGIWIDMTAGDGRLKTNLVGRRRPLTARGLAAAMLRRPVGSRRVLALIHWQALKLWWKGARYRPRPEPPEQEVSR